MGSFRQIHTQLVVNSLNHPNHLLSNLVRLHGDLRYAALIFSHIPHPNDFSYNIMIRASSHNNYNYPLALRFYLHMLRSGVTPNNYTYPFLLKAIAGLRSLCNARAAHASIFKSGLDSDMHTAHSLISAYLRCGELKSARKVFDEIAHKDVVSWNSMISGCAEMGHAREAVELFGRMRDQEGFEPCEMTFASVLKACAGLGDRELGKEVEGLVKERGIEPAESFVGSALVNMHAKCGDLESARRVFDGIKDKVLAVWNSMIAGQVQCFFREMVKNFIALCKRYVQTTMYKNMSFYIQFSDLYYILLQICNISVAINFLITASPSILQISSLVNCLEKTRPHQQQQQALKGSSKHEKITAPKLQFQLQDWNQIRVSSDIFAPYSSVCITPSV